MRGRIKFRILRCDENLKQSVTIQLLAFSCWLLASL